MVYPKSFWGKPYSEVPPLRNSFHENSLIGFLCKGILLTSNRLCIPWYKKHFIFQRAIKIVKKTILKYALLYNDLIVLASTESFMKL